MLDRKHVAAIVAAYTRQNAIANHQLPDLIASVASALNNVANPSPIDGPRVGPAPAVPIRRSVQPDQIICLECGHSGSMLKRHIFTKHALTPDAYRDRWGLKPDYPMVASDYTARRSEIAKMVGLGHLRGSSEIQPAEPENIEVQVPADGKTDHTAGN
jgi:predicted transcriptional regulator